MALRARIVLSCREGVSNSQVARKLRVTGSTVGKWRERFRKEGMEGRLDEPRVGAPRKITDQQMIAASAFAIIYLLSLLLP